MHRVKRAIIMAAGFTVIDALHRNNICEVYIVVGYLKEQFHILEEKYSDVNFIENPYYSECNNISSLYMARNYLEDAIILDGDQIINNHKVLEPEFEKSGYNAVWTEQKTEEWLMQVENGKVISCSRDGGERGWQLFSISRWTEEDGKRLRTHLEEEFIKKIIKNKAEITQFYFL